MAQKLYTAPIHSSLFLTLTSCTASEDSEYSPINNINILLNFFFCAPCHTCLEKHEDE